MTVRQQEDRDALAALAAYPVHLPFLAGGYEAAPALGDVAELLAQHLDALAPRSVLFPLGIFHSDHIATHDATIRLVRDRPQIRWCVYEELPYRYEHPKLADRQKRVLLDEDFGLRDITLPRDPSKVAKLRIIRCYRSQLKALGWNRVITALREERYWQISVLGKAEVG